ncbi:MAG: hypothetical protein P3C12_14045 [Gemmatimonadota bacterium]|nr:hypothetical protein [Gemmatimonadota bacterium]
MIADAWARHTREQAKAAYQFFRAGSTVYGSFGTAKEYCELANNALDDDLRSGALFKLGVRATTMLAERLLGLTLTSHPYYVLHREHFEVLVKALNASAAGENAFQSYLRVMNAVDTTSRVKTIRKALAHRRDQLLLGWWLELRGMVETDPAQGRNPAAAAQAFSARGGAPLNLSARTEESLTQWRGEWFLLLQDATALSIMVRAESDAAEEAMDRYGASMEQLRGTDVFSTVRRDELARLQGYDRISRSGAGTKKYMPSAAFAGDPEHAAQAVLERLWAVERLNQRLARACDIVMSPLPVTSPNEVQRRISEALR